MSPKSQSRYKNRIALFAILLIIFLIVDIYIFINRRDGYNHICTDYKSLYYLNDQPGIAGFDISDDSLLTVEFYNLSADRWSIEIDSGRVYDFEGQNPLLELLRETHTYTIKPKSPDIPPVILNIAYSPRDVYEAADNPTLSAIHVISSTLPIGRHDAYFMKDFIYRSDHYDPDDVKQGNKILDSIDIKRSDDTETKILQLGRFLISSLKDQGGIPIAEMYKISPLKQFELARRGKSRVWCSNYQQIYTFFATLAQIPTRMVGTTGKLDDVILSGHAFAESYIREKNQWAYIELSTGKAFVRNASDDFLNTADLYHAINADNIAGLKATTFNDTIWTEMPFSKAAGTEKYYFTRDAVLTFPRARKNTRSLGTRINRYLFQPDPVYALECDNFKIYLRLTLLYLTALFGILLFNMIRRHRN